MTARVVTTTVFSIGPTATSALSARSHSSVPVGAIVGGVIGGAALAVLVTVTWIYWGKQIKKTKRMQQEELDKSRRTRYNTLQNARISGPKNPSYRPLLRGHGMSRVKFSGDEKAPTSQPPAENVDLERAKHMLFDNPNTPSPRPAWLPDLSIRRSGSITWPLPHKKNSQTSVRNASNDDSNNAEGLPSVQPENNSSTSREAEKLIAHKPSNVSAVTAQSSNASGDSRRQSRVPSNLIFAALGGNNSNRSSLRAGERHSNASLWSYLFRAVPGARSSQHSYGENMHQASEVGDQAFPVGTAV
ncbi:hypothetical protein D9756_001797 [Leucocoprinus leucothites]|uniref:Uncharacterized protein n=1 Tax=Leucocoprinus leucothites TaxID=201217 RepID=A0A8H5G4F9_9AGAR|nr:hypothetical protein D9756_001797 [Leucoagaricus leucothites]